MASVLLLISQVALICSVTLVRGSGHSDLTVSSRLLASSVVALTVPPIIASWLLLASVPLGTATALSTAALTTATVLWLLRQRDPATRSLRLAAVNWALAIPLALALGVQFVGAALKPEGSIDGLLYHGPALANMVGTGSLFGWESANQYVYYPDLQMVLAGMWMRATELVSLEDAVQAPFVAMAVLAIYVMSRQSEDNRLLRIWLSLAAVLAPVIWSQGRVLYVDVAAAALLATGVSLLVAARREGHTPLVLISGLALGSAIATKPSALFAGAVCFVVLIGFIAAWRRWALLLATTGVFIVSGAPFYLRNWLSFANPFYPVTTDLGPIKFPGIISSELFYAGQQAPGLVDPTRLYYYAKNLWVGMKLGSPRWLYDPREGGFGRTPLFLLGMLLVFLVATLVVQWVRSRNATAGLRTPDGNFWLILAVAAAIVVVQPNPSDARYGIAAYLLLTGAGLTLFALLPQIQPVLFVTTTAVVVVALLGLVRSEANMLFGLRESVTLARGNAAYNTGIDGSAVSYGDAFAWLRGSDCPTVLAQTLGGLTPSGMPGEGLLTTYQYGLWGDQLCNKVHFLAVPTPTRADEVLSQPSIAAMLTGVDFLVVDDRSLRSWSKKLSALGLDYLEVAGIPASDYFPVGQTVLEIQR